MSTVKTKFEIPKRPANLLNLPAPFGYAESSKKDPVEFNKQQRYIIRNIYRNHIKVSNAVRHFIKSSIKNGIVVKISVSGKTYEFSNENTETSEYYSKIILPGIKQIFLEWILYGYARVKINKADKKYEYPYFVDIPDDTTEEVFWRNNKGERVYEMRYKNSGYNQNNKVVPGGMLLILDRPDEDGCLTSPVARASTQISKQEILWYCFLKSSLYQCTPPFVLASESEKSTDQLSGEMVFYEGQASLYGTSDAKSKYQKSFPLQQVQKALYTSHLSRYANDYTNGDLPASTLRDPSRAINNNNFNPNANILNQFDIPNYMSQAKNTIPWHYGFTTAPGQKLQQPPKSNAPEGFKDVIDLVITDVIEAIGVPPELFGKNSKQHAANVELVQETLRSNIQTFHNEAKPKLLELFKRMFESFAHQKIFEHSKKIKKNLDTEYLKKEKSNIKVEVDFNSGLIMSLDSIYSMHEKGVISTDDMQESALKITGLPKYMKLKNSDQVLAKRLSLFAKAEAEAKASIQNKNSQNQKNNDNTITTTTIGSDGKRATIVKKTSYSSSSSSSSNQSEKKRKRENSSSSSSSFSNKNNNSNRNKKQKN